MEDEIKFYSESGEYGEFSNFSYYPIKLKGKIWQTSEHYFQAQKFENEKYQDKTTNLSLVWCAATTQLLQTKTSTFAVVNVADLTICHK